MATKTKFYTDNGLQSGTDAQIDGDLTVTGDLTVNGTQTTVNSTTTSVTDSLFELANQNTSSDTLDIGIYGNYDDGLSDGGASEYTGLFRDASDSTWKLFDGLESEPTTTVNTSGTGYAKAALEVGDLSATTITATNSITGASLTYPTSDGTNGQVLTTNGSGTLSFADAAGGASSLNDLSDVKTFGTSSIMIGDTTTGTINAANHNTGVGVDIFASLTSGDQNNAFGHASLGSCTTGSYNCAFGQATLYSLTDGVNNTAMGDNAMQFGTSQDVCVAIGQNALRYVTGNNNTAVGAGAGDTLTAGDKNTFIGREAGTACTTGDNNVSIGGSAGYDATDGHNNVFIGVNTRTDNAGTNTQIVLGPNARSQGSGKFTVGTSNSTYSVLTVGGTSWSGSSDERLKKEIVDSPAGLSFINDLRPVNFKWKTKGEVDETLPHYEENSNEPVIGNSDTNILTKHGFIAQEVKEVIDNHPEIKDGSDIWDVNSDGIENFAPTALIPMLVKSIQELSAKCDSLQNEVNTLKGE